MLTPDVRPEHVARDAVVWLTDEQAEQVMELMSASAYPQAKLLLLSLIPDLPTELDLTDPVFAAQLTGELSFRLDPPDDEDPDLLATREIPDYTRFAQPVA
jgi:hypothetical protein